MFDDPKPEDVLRTTVGDWKKNADDNFNAGIDACIELIQTQVQVTSSYKKEQPCLLLMSDKRRRVLIGALQKLKLK